LFKNALKLVGAAFCVAFSDICDNSVRSFIHLGSQNDSSNTNQLLQTPIQR
jgi:hypothetical protein